MNEHLALSFEIEVRGLEALLTDCEIAALAVQILCLDIFQQFSVQIGLLLLKKRLFTSSSAILIILTLGSTHRAMALVIFTIYEPLTSFYFASNF